MEITVGKVEDLRAVAEKIILATQKRRIVLLNGEMGAGKTTLVKEIASLLGVKENVTSPTFSIVNEYEGEELIYHFDLYRLEEEEEAYDFGIEEYFDSGNLCFLEWPEKISNLLPGEEECLVIDIVVKDNVRYYKF